MRLLLLHADRASQLEEMVASVKECVLQKNPDIILVSQTGFKLPDIVSRKEQLTFLSHMMRTPVICAPVNEFLGAVAPETYQTIRLESYFDRNKIPYENEPKLLPTTAPLTVGMCFSSTGIYAFPQRAFPQPIHNIPKRPYSVCIGDELLFAKPEHVRSIRMLFNLSAEFDEPFQGALANYCCEKRITVVRADTLPELSGVLNGPSEIVEQTKKYTLLYTE